MTILLKEQLPTNDQLREQAILSLPPDNTPGNKANYLKDVLAKYLELQFLYFPAFCEHTRIINAQHNKELEDHGIRSKMMMIGGEVCGNTVGWSKDGTMKSQWIIPEQLKYFMEQIDKGFWTDDNIKVRNSFMKGVLRGDDPHGLLNKVYSYYGTNYKEPLKEEAIGETSIST